MKQRSSPGTFLAKLGLVVKPVIYLLAVVVFAFASHIEAASSIGNGHQITQSLAIRYNQHIPQDYVNRPIQLKQYFLPESWVEVLLDSHATTTSGWKRFVSDPSKPGWVRVLIHPFDKVSSSRIEEALKEAQLPQEASQFEEPFRVTESRSLYPDSVPAGTTPVSPRLSMTNGFGKWGGTEKENDGFGNGRMIYTKLISSEQARFAYQASEIIQKQLRGTNGYFFKIQPDRMVVLIKSPSGNLDMGETFRDISDVSERGQYSLPGFINQDLRALSILSLINDSGSLLEYLRDVVAPRRGQGIAEFYGRTGFVHSSPHSQNFLETTDESFKLASELKIRDLADLIPTVDERSRNSEMAKLYEDFTDAREALRNQLDGGEKHFAFRHSFFKGAGYDQIFTHEELQEIEMSVSKAFIATLAEMSGVSFQAIESIANRSFHDLKMDYAITFFNRKSRVWADVQAGLLRFRKNPRPLTEAISTYRRLKKVDLKNIEIERNIKLAAVFTLKGDAAPQVLSNQIKGYWHHRNRLALSTAQIQFVANALVALHIDPSQDLSSLFEVAVMGTKSGTQRESIIKLIFKNFNQDPNDTAKFAFLDRLRSQDDLKNKLSYSEISLIKTELEYLLNGTQNATHKPASPKLAEAVFFALLPFGGKYMQDTTILFLNYIRNTGGIPVSIQDYLRNWQHENKAEESWITEKIMNARGLPVNPDSMAVRCRKVLEGS